MKYLKRIFLYNVENKRRFQFQSLFENQQIKDQLILLIQQMKLFFNGGLTLKEIMKVVNNLNDQQLNGVKNLHKIDFENLKEQVLNYENKANTNGLIFAKEIISNIFKENE